jgi:hypothetical protein
MSPVYTAVLILNPRNRTRYIETHWPKKWLKLVLAKVKKLWEKYREMPIITPMPLAFRQKGSSHEPPELDMYNCIALSLRAEARLAS